jgi:uncharacterized membrane protein
MSSLRNLVLACFAALSVLCIAWELWLAPLRPGGSMLVLKAVPLMLGAARMATGRLRAFQWWSMLILAYLAEGLVRAMSDRGPGAYLGWIEAALAAIAFGAILGYVRARRRISAPLDTPPG